MNAPAEFMVGHFPGMPFAEYAAIRAISASGAKHILRSPRHYREAIDTPKEPTSAMQLGSAVHCGVLEPETFADRYVRAPDCDKRTKEGKARWQEFQDLNVGRIVLAGDVCDTVRRCIDSVLASSAAQALLRGAEIEGSLCWYDQGVGVRCKGRYDVRSMGGLTDLKTCADASPEGFANQAARLRYNLSAAFYVSGSEHVLNASPGFFAFICVETEPPYACAVYDLPGVAVRAGSALMDEALRRYAKALKTGEWHGYSPKIETLNWPRWAA